MNIITTRNHNIDALKLLCAFLVVIIHIPLFAKNYIFNIVLSAVPCFFIISGFLIYNPDKKVMKAKLTRNIKRILIILLWSMPLYLIFDMMQHNSWEQNDFILLIRYNALDYQAGYHLWYLFAYVYVLIIIYFTVCLNKLNWLKATIPILLIGGLLLSTYSTLILNHSYPKIYSRNYLFTGIPFFVLGMYIKEHFQLISNLKSIARYSRYALLISIGLTLTESIFLQHTNLIFGGDLYIGTTLTAISLFLTFALSPQNYFNRLSALGESVALHIYIFHLAIAYLLTLFIDKDSAIYQYNHCIYHHACRDNGCPMDVETM